jgi:hypothetical protein
VCKDEVVVGAIARALELVKSADAAQLDAVIALAMAAERASTSAPPARLLGWI